MAFRRMSYGIIHINVRRIKYAYIWKQGRTYPGLKQFFWNCFFFILWLRKNFFYQNLFLIFFFNSKKPIFPKCLIKTLQRFCKLMQCYYETAVSWNVVCNFKSTTIIFAICNCMSLPYVCINFIRISRDQVCEKLLEIHPKKMILASSLFRRL